MNPLGKLSKHAKRQTAKLLASMARIPLPKKRHRDKKRR